jgi:predicted RNA-binding Zn ribbon-like protein
MSTGADIGWAADPHLPKGQWLATTRFGLRPAPHGLALVEDFLNTGAEATQDLLADITQAQAWSTRACHAWSLERDTEMSPAPVLIDGDDARLRELRDRLGGLVSGAGTAACIGLGVTEFVLSAAGELHWQPTGNGWQWWSAAICTEVMLSQHSGTWQRLKLCGNDSCRVVFYDRSWNNSAELHAGHACATERLPAAAIG